MVAPTPGADTDLDHALWALSTYHTTALGTIGPHGPHVAGVFFAPERRGGGIRLIVSVLRDSRKHREMLADPRVAFMCSPGTPVRWIQGSGLARAAEPAEHHTLHARLLAHAPGAHVFVDRLPVVPMLVEVSWLKVVDDPARPPLVLDLDPAA